MTLGVELNMNTTMSDRDRISPLKIKYNIKQTRDKKREKHQQRDD